MIHPTPVNHFVSRTRAVDGPPRLQTLKNLVLATALLTAIPAWPQHTSKELGEKSIEDLMNLEVTSVSKKEQKLYRTAAAIFVITQEDIRRSGATNIPDLLRMVPGLDVAQINGSTWAIGSRGFNQQFSNKLLVMIDRRIVYTPNFAGVYWDTLDLPLEDIDRIEVIRGPGGARHRAKAGSSPSFSAAHAYPPAGSGRAPMTKNEPSIRFASRYARAPASALARAASARAG